MWQCKRNDKYKVWSDNNNHVLCSLLCHSLAHHDIKSSCQGDVCKNPTANNAQPTKPVVHTCCILKPHVHSHGSSGETYLFNLSIAERDFEDLGILRIERFWGLRDLKDSEILRIERCGKDFPTCGFVPCYLLDCTWWAYFVHIPCFATAASFTWRLYTLQWSAPQGIKDNKRSYVQPIWGHSGHCTLCSVCV